MNDSLIVNRLFLNCSLINTRDIIMVKVYKVMELLHRMQYEATGFGIGIMKLTSAFIVILVAIASQNIEAKSTEREIINTENVSPIEPFALAKQDRDLRGVKDVWNKIKEGAIKTWNYIKEIAQQTKDKFDKWIDDVKSEANEIKQQFEKRLNELKEKINIIITDIYGTGEFVKECIKSERENIESVLKEILQHMVSCVADELKKIVLISDGKGRLILNDTSFIEELDNKYELCEGDTENFQECLRTVREDIFDNFTELQNEIIENHFVTRSLAEDIKGSVVSCSIDYLSNASYLISEEMMEIGRCVLDAKEKNNNTQPSPLE